MKKEYDFTNAEKGKFYRKDAEIVLPLYLEPDIQEHFEKLALKNKMDFSEIINNFLKKSIQLSKSLNL